MAKTTRQHIEMTRLDSSGNEYILYPKTTVNDVYTSPTSNVDIENKIIFHGVCNTAANEKTKNVTIPGFSLINGVHVTITFINGTSTGIISLNINGTGAKQILHNSRTILANDIRPGETIEFVYRDGYWYTVGDKIYVENVNNAKLYILGTPDSTPGSPRKLNWDTGVYISATSGELVAGSFSGNGTKLEDLDASKVTRGTLPAERLPTSGVTTSSSVTAGPSSDKTLTNGGSYEVPRLVIDKYGRILGAKTFKFTLPTLTDKNVEVTFNNPSSNNERYYLTGVPGATNDREYTGGEYSNQRVYIKGYDLYALGCAYTQRVVLGASDGDYDVNYITKSKYTGEAATVSSISSHIVDSVTSTAANGETTKALSANQGYLLQEQIDELSTTMSDDYWTLNNCKSYIDANVSALTSNISSLSTKANTLENNVNWLINHGSVFRLATTTFTFWSHGVTAQGANMAVFDGNVSTGSLLYTKTDNNNPGVWSFHPEYSWGELFTQYNIDPGLVLSSSLVELTRWYSDGQSYGMTSDLSVGCIRSGVNINGTQVYSLIAALNVHANDAEHCQIKIAVTYLAKTED